MIRQLLPFSIPDNDGWSVQKSNFLGRWRKNRAEMNHRKRKQRVLQLLHTRLHHPAFRWSSAEDRDWDSMAPVGREFGSPDYERLMQEDSLDLKRALAELISRGQAAVAAKSQPVDLSELSDALNVQAALREWGHEVDVLVAASVWRSYSHSLRAEWLSGVGTLSAEKLTLFYYCSRQRSAAIARSA